MLILTRNINSSIMIGDDVRIRVLDIRGNQVRLGIYAPKSVSVHREEIYYKIKSEDNSPLYHNDENSFIGDNP